MADGRRVQILMLYVTRNDHLPQPLRRTHTTAGFNHDQVARESCPDCLANSRVMAGCETCHGRGYVEVHRARDPYAVENVQPYGIDGSLPAAARDRDAQIDRLAVQLAAPYASPADEIDDANRHPYGWERLRAAMYRDFDYRALDVALERLHGEHPGVAPLSPRGMELLDGWLPTPLRAPRLTVRPANLAARGRAADPKARAQRDRRVRELLAGGASWDEVAATVGLSAKQLRRIVNRNEEAA